jgi:hypothetical protein
MKNWYLVDDSFTSRKLQIRNWKFDVTACSKTCIKTVSGIRQLPLAFHMSLQILPSNCCKESAVFSVAKTHIEHLWLTVEVWT